MQETKTQRYKQSLWVTVVLAVVLASAFYLSPIESGDDWETFSHGGINIINRQSLYAPFIHSRHADETFVNPPHVALLLLPLAILPFRAGWALVCSLTLLSIGSIGLRYQFGLLKTGLTLASPFTFYILLHGQIDALVMTCLHLPAWFWIAAAFGKPQVAVGLVPASLRDRRGWIVSFILLTLAVGFRFWEGLATNAGLVNADFNVLRGLWPQSIIVGLAVLILGWWRQNKFIMIASSPFFFPYATMSSMLPVWIGLTATLHKYFVLTVWCLLWAVIVLSLG